VQTGGHQPAKYNEEVHDAIIQALLEGASKSMAFKLAGLNAQTPFDWVTMGKKNPEKYPHYWKLGEDIELAIATVQKQMVDRLRQTALSGAPHTWQAAAWYLERTAPEDFGKRDKVEVTAPDGPLVQLNQVVLGDADTRALGRDLLRRVTSPPTHLAIGPGDDSEPAEDVG
jgi:hypothetical protein